MAIRPAGPGRYTGHVDPGWSGPVAPNGGVLTAIMVRAAQAELGPAGPPPRTVAAHFLEAPAAGSTELTVEVLRRGKRVAACEVRLYQGERLACQATIICSAARQQAFALEREAPPAAPSAATAPLPSGAGTPRMLERLELRPRFGEPIFSAARDALAGGWAALRGDDAPLDAARLCALCDLWWPALYPMLEHSAALPTIQLTIHLRATHDPGHGPVLARFETRTIAEGHLEERGELWSTGGRLLAESVQLALAPPPAPA